MTDTSKEIDEIAREADATADDPMPSDAAPTRPNKSVVVAVRLTPEDAQAIDDLSTSSGIPASALIRTWVAAGLAANRDESLASAIDRLSADVDRLKQFVA